MFRSRRSILDENPALILIRAFVYEVVLRAMDWPDVSN